MALARHVVHGYHTCDQCGHCSHLAAVEIAVTNTAVVEVTATDVGAKDDVAAAAVDILRGRG